MNEKFTMAEEQSSDIAQDILLDTLDGLKRSIKERGAGAIGIVKQPCHDEEGAEHWTIQVSIKPKTAKPAPTFVPAEAPTKPS